MNDASAEEAAKDAAALASLFGFASKEGASSIFAADCVEVMKSPYLGEKGHLAIRCNDVERAVARFRGLGIGIVAGTEKADKGRLKTVYLDKGIGGFAIHLLRA
jgi:2-dehydro-3-deoxyphosphogluconate aldolase/(4S)-4-hydroxy-2-oxoglutarate aldolase